MIVIMVRDRYGDGEAWAAHAVETEADAARLDGELRQLDPAGDTLAVDWIGTSPRDVLFAEAARIIRGDDL